MWGVYGDAEKVATLAASLNEKGEREGSLWSELQRRFGAPRVEGPKPPSVRIRRRRRRESGRGRRDRDRDAARGRRLGSDGGRGTPPARRRRRRSRSRRRSRPSTPSSPSRRRRPDDGAWKPPRPVGAENSEPTGPGAAIAAARTELLAIDAALPDDAMCPARGSQTRRASWRRMTTSATDPATLAIVVRAPRGVAREELALSGVAAVVEPRARAARGVESERLRRRRGGADARARVAAGRRVGRRREG